MAKGSKSCRHVLNEAQPLPLTKECQHFDRRDEVPEDTLKYWQQRYSIFQHYDYGIQLTHDAWFGVTPEPVATEIAQHTPPAHAIIDLFAGAGGNAIAFAISGRYERVIAVEKDAATLACAQQNARVYEVEQYITFVHADCFDYLRALRRLSRMDAAGGGEEREHGTMETRKGEAEADNGEEDDGEIELGDELKVDLLGGNTVLFASPPWGGPGYRNPEIFDLSIMEPYNLAQLHDICRGAPHALYLPRTSDVRQIAALLPKEESSKGTKIEIVQYCMEGASKAMVAYIPAF